jgi:hypothetical protein
VEKGKEEEKAGEEKMEEAKEKEENEGKDEEEAGEEKVEEGNVLITFVCVYACMCMTIYIHICAYIHTYIACCDARWVHHYDVHAGTVFIWVTICFQAWPTTCLSCDCIYRYQGGEEGKDKAETKTSFYIHTHTHTHIYRYQGGRGGQGQGRRAREGRRGGGGTRGEGQGA